MEKILQKMRLVDIKPADYNPREISDANFDALVESIKKFGLVEPLVVNSRNKTVVGGNQRLMALKKLNYEECDVVLVELTDDEERVLNIALNNPALQGYFTDKTISLLNQIKKETPDLFDKLRFFEIDIEKIKEIAKGPTDKNLEKTYQAIALRPFEHYDYVVILATNSFEWNKLLDFFKLERVDSKIATGISKIGLGRGIPAKKFIELLGDKHQQS